LEAEGPGYQPTGRGFHVLVVDEDRDAAECLCALLRIWGYQSEACYDDTDGLRLACEYQPDCLVVDIDIPDLVGHKLARKLRMHLGLGRVRLVALTLHSDDANVQFSREAGFDFHFVKPMSKFQIQRLKMLMDTLSELVQAEGKTEELV
jgi:CheY-like chemotaxis protein